MLKSRFSNYNDGIVYIVRKKPKSTNFNAAKNALSRGDLEDVVKLACEEKRQERRGCRVCVQPGQDTLFKDQDKIIQGGSNAQGYSRRHALQHHQAGS